MNIKRGDTIRSCHSFFNVMVFICKCSIAYGSDLNAIAKNIVTFHYGCGERICFASLTY